VGYTLRERQPIMKSDYTQADNPMFLYTAAVNHPFPEWVSNQAVPEASEFEKLASTAFADSKNRRLPVSSKVSTFYSALDLFARPDTYGEQTFERIKQACAFFGIEQDVAPYALMFVDRQEKSAAIDELPGQYALDTELGGEHFRLFPVNDKQDVQMSAEELSKMASDGRIPYVLARQAARTIVMKADELDARIPSLLRKAGEARYPDFAKAAKALIGRTALVGELDPAIEADYQEAVKVAAEAEDELQAAEECVEKIATLDLLLGIDNALLSARATDPAAIVYQGPSVVEVEKAAADNVAVTDTVTIPLPNFKRVSLPDLDFKLNKEASTQLASVINTDDAKDISLAVMQWDEEDRKTLLRSVLAANA